MNLSSYLQMPPAPLVTNNVSPALPQGMRTGVGPSAGTGLGFDFADVMARQLQRLAPQQRQTFAADVAEPTTADTRAQDRHAAEDTRSTERETTHTPSTSSDEAATTRAHDAGDARDDHSAPHPTSGRARKASTSPSDVEALLEGLMQGATRAPAPTVPPTPSETRAAEPLLNAPELAARVVAPPLEPQAMAPLATSGAPTALQTVALSQHMRIITDPKAAPSPESLTAFAKSMGLDESAIQSLMAQQPVAATAATDTLTPDLAGLATTSTPPTNGLLTGSSAPLAATPFDDAMATQLAALNAANPTGLPDTPTLNVNTVVSGAGLAAATTLAAPAAIGMAGLTPADMAAIQQLQITVLPPVALPANTHATQTSAIPSTLEMLSLFGAGVDEQDVSALLSRFSEEAGGDTSSGQQSSSGEDSPQLGSFGQTLANVKTASNGVPAQTGAATAAKMSEAYDQLSDKMATELAARMHKQLSDGEWKMKFALRPSNLGGVEIQLEMKDGKLDAVFRADNPLTRDLIQNSSQRLREALANFGVNAGQVNVGQGGGHAQQHSSGQPPQQAQVRDNSTSQVNGTSNVTDVASSRSKANASLLDLYA